MNLMLETDEKRLEGLDLTMENNNWFLDQKRKGV